MKNRVHLLQKEHDVIQLFIAGNKAKTNEKKQLMLQENCIVHEAIKI
jgi:hypothetical protein